MNPVPALTSYHAKYAAYELSRLARPDQVDRLTASLFDAQIKLNPHQVEAALFALRSPLTGGVLLADEVGLGKTIEAALVLCQYWAERKRRLLVICPATLRKQWSLELTEKFALPNIILDTRTYNQHRKQGIELPFDRDEVVIISMNFAARMKSELQAIDWNLVVIDEAHKLRNSYQPGNKIGQALRAAIAGRRKILLTATPLQNSLLELFGLIGMLDERVFGDVSGFRAKYTGKDVDLDELRTRLNPLCRRTLRSQVQQYVRYTQRRAITIPFAASDNEQSLYEAVSAFLSHDDTYAIPYRQRHLTLLIVRKLLASSTRAILATLKTILRRLEKMRDTAAPKIYQLDFDVSALFEDEDIVEEFFEDAEDASVETINETPSTGNSEEPIDRAKLEAEIAEISRLIRLAQAIATDTKSTALLSALRTGFAQLEQFGAANKALIFTESRRTQDYLKAYLESNGYGGKIVLFNGSNSDAESKAIYDAWLTKNAGTGRSSGSRIIDIRSALVEHFRDSSTIMIATEAAAEGVNLQFCSLVINYDLPWNPQRIEQRIGRCHRYGQKHDVVVVNFLNERNAADQRVLELLDSKFQLFNGVFGASDEVLGAIESGIDIQDRILQIYQQCRTTEEIDTAFAQLRSDMEQVIQDREAHARRVLLENFDHDVHQHLEDRLDETRARLTRAQQLIWSLCKYVLSDLAEFDEPTASFDLLHSPRPEVVHGRYRLVPKSDPEPGIDEFVFRLTHPIGEHVLTSGKHADTPRRSVCFDVSGHPVIISMVEQLKGKSGWLSLDRVILDAFDREEQLLFTAFQDEGSIVDQETCEKLMTCAARVESAAGEDADAEKRLGVERSRRFDAAVASAMLRNEALYDEQRDTLERWARDVIESAEHELDLVKAQIRQAKANARKAPSTTEKTNLERKVRDLEKRKVNQRTELFRIEDEVEKKKDELFDTLERRLSTKTQLESLFTIRWSVA